MLCSRGGVARNLVSHLLATFHILLRTEDPPAGRSSLISLFLSLSNNLDMLTIVIYIKFTSFCFNIVYNHLTGSPIVSNCLHFRALLSRGDTMKLLSIPSLSRSPFTLGLFFVHMIAPLQQYVDNHYFHHEDSLVI